MPSSRNVSDAVDFSKAVKKEDLKGKTALVTGGARGVGASVTKTLAKAGVFVTIADVDAEAGQKYAFTLMIEGLRVGFVTTDVRDWNSQVNAFKQCVKHSPSHVIDIVIACADTDSRSSFFGKDASTDQHPPSLDVIQVNLIGSFYTAALAVQFFRESGAPPNPSSRADKQLILMSSTAAYTSVPLDPAHSMSETGVRGLWKSLRSRPETTGIRMNLIALPYALRSPLFAAARDGKGDDARSATMEEVVDVLMRVVCDEDIRGSAVQLVPGSEAIDLYDRNESGSGRQKVLGGAEMSEPKPGGSLQESRSRKQVNNEVQRGAKRKLPESSLYLTVPPHPSVRSKLVSIPSDKEIKQMYSCLPHQSATDLDEV